MAISALNSAASGMYANQVRQNVAANNVANVNTDGFKASTVQTGDAAYVNDIGQGTRVTGAYAPPRPGPVAPSPTAQGGMVEQSNTDVATEMSSSMGAQRAYDANAAVVRTADEMVGTLLDVKA